MFPSLETMIDRTLQLSQPTFRRLSGYGRKDKSATRRYTSFFFQLKVPTPHWPSTFRQVLSSLSHSLHFRGNARNLTNMKEPWKSDDQIKIAMYLLCSDLGVYSFYHLPVLRLPCSIQCTLCSALSEWQLMFTASGFRCQELEEFSLHYVIVKSFMHCI